ncbi:MAG TPA: universal stress protein [Methanosarcina sp.]|jgi:nucleotide-binding universal stress UspA family protein|nr:universal stress protein [Methanosarcina sp.]
MATVNFKKIMIATDGSDCSRLAAEKGIELARLSGGTVYSVCVVSTTSLSMYMDYLSSTGVSPNWELIYEGLKIQAQQAVDYVKDLGEKKGINVESIVLEGVPVDELIRYAEENGMDIIVMGTLGRTGIERLLLGSVAGNVVRHSKVPVMVVREKHKA